MTERKTGATAEQVEAAAFKHFANPGLTDDEYGEYAEWAMGETHRFASNLVDTDHRIVSVADLRALVASSSAGCGTPMMRRITALIGDEA